ncbi:MAG: class I SAM-dependent methyltransferase [Bacteroidia bacterium]|jgi:hypothetical protein|nr:class I SAM-dependent methyltransferase [Bacteroidia bacterium]
MTNCRICNSETRELFTHQVLKKYQVKYMQCLSCSFIQTEKPYWLDEAYESAINNNDTGILVRNERFKKITTLLFVFLFNKNAKFLDYAGGYGIFTRMMRDVGFDFYWDDDYAKNLLAIGFPHQPNTTYEAITAFEVFEHLEQPIDAVERMLKLSDTIVFSTEFITDKTPDQNWWYYAFSHGQHIAFYHPDSIKFIANKYGLNFYSNGSNFHMLTKRKFNNLLFKVMVKAAKYGLFHFAKNSIQPKTFSDHKQLS